jgi:hypothetical protein
MNEFEGWPINAADRYARGQLERLAVDAFPNTSALPHPSDYGPNFSQLVMWSDVEPDQQGRRRLASRSCRG